jgi:ElaB/YqjD/DUF883 family membrane-anchored ribosome-binding protein
MAQAAFPNDEARFPEYPDPGAAPVVGEPIYATPPVPARPAPTRSSLALNSAAENLGNTVASAVGRVKELPERMQELKQRFTVIRGRAREDLAIRAEELKEQAQRGVTRARTRAQSMARQQPFRFILGAAACGFVLGIMLRAWRDHAD